MSEDRALYPPQNPVANGIRGICPRCGQGRLFNGFLTLPPPRQARGAGFSFAHSAHGPAGFVILIVGFVIAGAALLVEIQFSPPIWVHAILWGPLVLILSL